MHDVVHLLCRTLGICSLCMNISTHMRIREDMKHFPQWITSMAYFVQVKMWDDCDETCLTVTCKIWVCFITIAPHDHLCKVSHWKQCIVGSASYLFLCACALKVLCIFVHILYPAVNLIFPFTWHNLPMIKFLFSHPVGGVTREQVLL